MRLLDDGQLGVRVGDGQVGVGRVPGAVQHQGPLLQEAVVHSLAVEADLKELRSTYSMYGFLIVRIYVQLTYFQRPLSPRVLCPRVRCHEGPLGEPVVGVVVVRPRREDHRPKRAQL